MRQGVGDLLGFLAPDISTPLLRKNSCSTSCSYDRLDSMYRTSSVLGRSAGGAVGARRAGVAQAPTCPAPACSSRPFLAGEAVLRETRGCCSSARTALQTVCSAAATLEKAPEVSQKDFPIPDKANRSGPRVLIAGGGIGGLVLAVGLLKKGFDVQVLERDLTAIRGEGKYRGPIQVRLLVRACSCLFLLCLGHLFVWHNGARA